MGGYIMWKVSLLMMFVNDFKTKITNKSENNGIENKLVSGFNAYQRSIGLVRHIK